MKSRNEMVAEVAVNKPATKVNEELMLKATMDIIAILEPLTHEERYRVLGAVAVMYNLADWKMY